MIRPYRESDVDALWRLKRGFELELGEAAPADESGNVETGSDVAGSAESGGAESGGAESGGAESGSAESGNDGGVDGQSHDDETGGDETAAKEKAIRYREKLDADYRESYLAWVGRCQAEEARAVQVAERDASLVGYVFVLPETMAHVWDAAVLNELYVDPDYRGGDVADDLLAEALAVARDQDLPMDRIVLDVDRENERARAVYDRWGFEHWGEMVAREL